MQGVGSTIAKSQGKSHTKERNTRSKIEKMRNLLRQENRSNNKIIIDLKNNCFKKDFQRSQNLDIHQFHNTRNILEELLKIYFGILIQSNKYFLFINILELMCPIMRKIYMSGNLKRKNKSFTLISLMKQSHIKFLVSFILRGIM